MDDTYLGTYDRTEWRDVNGDVIMYIDYGICIIYYACIIVYF